MILEILKIFFKGLSLKFWFFNHTFGFKRRKEKTQTWILSVLKSLALMFIENKLRTCLGIFFRDFLRIFL